MKNDVKKFIKFAIFIICGIFVLSLIAYFTNNKKTIDENESKYVKVDEIGQGFIYYKNELYYKNKYLCLIDSSEAGEEIGKNQKQLTKQQMSNNKFLYDGEEIVAYGVYVDTPVYSCKSNNDILLVENKDYMWNGYYIYVKGVTYSESSKRTSLQYYIDNPDEIESVKMISYGRNEIPIDLKISDFSKDENNSYSFATNDIQDGYMQYYLFIEDDGICSYFVGDGHILSDYIIIRSYDEGVETQYVCKYDKLNETLYDMYANFFGIEESNALDDSNINEIIDDISDNTQSEKIEESSSLPDEFEIEDVDITSKTQSDLKPLE